MWKRWGNRRRFSGSGSRPRIDVCYLEAKSRHRDEQRNCLSRQVQASWTYPFETSTIVLHWLPGKFLMSNVELEITVWGKKLLPAFLLLTIFSFFAILSSWGPTTALPLAGHSHRCVFRDSALWLLVITSMAASHPTCPKLGTLLLRLADFNWFYTLGFISPISLKWYRLKLVLIFQFVNNGQH